MPELFSHKGMVKVGVGHLGLQLQHAGVVVQRDGRMPALDGVIGQAVEGQHIVRPTLCHFQKHALCRFTHTKEQQRLGPPHHDEAIHTVATGSGSAIFRVYQHAKAPDCIHRSILSLTKSTQATSNQLAAASGIC